tara:strand:+ start:1137 stop:2276 length:1140 start_codon:yes stop_codon:yes gene_type:complete
MKTLGLKLILISILFFQCSTNKNFMNQLKIEKKEFGTTEDNVTVYQFVLSNENGMEVSIINYGGIITSLKAKDRHEKYQDIVLGFNSLAPYEDENPYFGALIGRYGNRIAKGAFRLDDKTYNLDINNAPNHLHGGLKGFHKVVWNPKEIINDTNVSLELTYLSKHMEEGYPGNLDVKVTYTLNNKDELHVLYEAETDKKTIINLTQHSYFNLSGDFSEDILNHEIKINADAFLPVDETLIPTGEIRSVEGSPFDFRNLKLIGRDIDSNDNQIKFGKGYDHCWVINNQDAGLRHVASLYHSQTGRIMEIESDQPGIQFYSGNFLDGTLESKGEGYYNYRTGLCLETQQYPDSPNQKNFPSVVLNPNEKYITKTIFKFSSK